MKKAMWSSSGAADRPCLPDCPTCCMCGSWRRRSCESRRHAERAGLTIEAATEIVTKRDIASHDFVRRHFGIDRRDPAHYDLVINTAKFTPADAADLIVSALAGLRGCGLSSPSAPGGVACPPCTGAHLRVCFCRSWVLEAGSRAAKVVFLEVRRAALSALQYFPRRFHRHARLRPHHAVDAVFCGAIRRQLLRGRPLGGIVCCRAVCRRAAIGPPVRS